MASAFTIAYLNGAYVPLAQARISPLDRGFLFADAVYEVIAVYGGRAFLLDSHIQRLERSLGELRIASPHDAAGWSAVIGGLVQRNIGAGHGNDMAIYLQVSRGADAGRDHRFPPGLAPTVFAMASPAPVNDLSTSGIRAITGPDNRWGRCDIKSTALLANVLLRQAAIEAGAGEFIMLRDGQVTEGSGSSVLIVERDTVLSRPNGMEILPGTTIRMVRDVALACGLGYREEIISESRLRAADEVWITAAMRGVAPVTHIDGQPVGAGRPGPAWRMVATEYERRKRS